MMTDFKTAIRSGKSEGEAIALVGQTAGSLMKDYFAAASDGALLALLRDDWIPIFTKYKDTNSPACIAALDAAATGKFKVEQPLPDSDASITARLYEMVMRSGASKIPVPFDKNAAEYDFDRIIDSLGAKYGPNALQLLETENKWMDNSQKVCDMLLAMFEQMAALPETRGANVVRYFLTLRSSDESQAALATSPAVTYRVVKTDLNLRAGPGANYLILTKLPVGTRGITLRDGRTANGTTLWQQVSVNGYTGWVNEIYLEAEPEIRKAKPVR
jgi:hypothetical protein